MAASESAKFPITAQTRFFLCNYSEELYFWVITFEIQKQLHIDVLENRYS